MLRGCLKSTPYVRASSLARPTSFNCARNRVSNVKRWISASPRSLEDSFGGFYNMPVAGLTDEQQEFRSSIETFAQRSLLPRADEIDKTNQFPMDMWKQFGEMGLLGITCSSEYGGLEMGYFMHVIAMEELSRASASVALSYGAHSNLCVNQIHRHGTKEQKSKYLPPLISGEKVGALAMSEHNAGSDVVSMKLKAVKKGDRYILDGTKFWITNGPIADTLVVYAKTSPEKKSRGITAFIIEKGMKGFRTGTKLDKVGMRGSDTAELIFEGCEVPEENVLGKVDGGAAVLMSGLDLERLVLSGGPLGIAQAAFSTALLYSHERSQFGKPVATFQLMQGKIADMYVKLNSARSYVYAVARACDKGEISRRDCAGAILYSTEKAIEIALEAMQCLGGNGYINEYPTGRYLRDARLYAVGAGTQEVRRMLIGREFNEEILGKGSV